MLLDNMTLFAIGGMKGKDERMRVIGFRPAHHPSEGIVTVLRGEGIPDNR